MNTDNTTPATTQTQDQATQTSEEAYMNTDNTISALIDRTLAIIDKSLDRSVGDMNLMQAMDLVGVLMDIRERQLVYAQQSNPKPARACEKLCAKKPKRK